MIHIVFMLVLTTIQLNHQSLGRNQNDYMTFWRKKIIDRQEIE